MPVPTGGRFTAFGGLASSFWTSSNMCSSRLLMFFFDIFHELLGQFTVLLGPAGTRTITGYGQPCDRALAQLRVDLDHSLEKSLSEGVLQLLLDVAVRTVAPV